MVERDWEGINLDRPWPKPKPAYSPLLQPFVLFHRGEVYLTDDPLSIILDRGEDTGDEAATS